MKLDGRKGSAAHRRQGGDCQHRADDAEIADRHVSMTPRCQCLQPRDPAQVAMGVAGREHQGATAPARRSAPRSSEASTARMKASASGPTKWPCTLVENSSGRNTAITTSVA